jgi:iron complex transport system substrate-binding protein
MTRAWLRVVLIACAAICLAYAQPNRTAAIPPAHGGPNQGSAVAASDERVATRIVSLVPSFTETLFAIGAGPQVVGVSSFDRDPPEVARLPRVGGLLDPDLERILQLRPDLVVTYGSQTALAQQLGRANIRTVSYRHGTIRDVLSSIEEAGRLTGHLDRARRLGADIEARLAAIRARTAGHPRPSVLLVFGREPLALRGIYASGGVGFLHELIEIGGGRDVFADVPRESVQATTELILARRPDIIIEIRADPMDPTTMRREEGVWSSLPAVPAVRDRRVILLTGSELVTPGPRIAQAAERLSRAIHPETWR